tara:strand:- start:1249 stop:1761 length:513 start_codon:yes stop_codon:yes gene_type:complete
MSQLKVNSIVPIGGVASGQGGGIIQTIQTFKNNSFSSTSTSYVDITGFSVEITPKAANSKILLLSCAGISTTGGTSVIYMNLLRGSTAIAQPASTTGFASTATCFPAVIRSMESWSFTFLDSPTYTVGDTLTYKWQAKTNSEEFTINNRDPNLFDDMNRTGTMIAKEVST